MESQKPSIFLYAYEPSPGVIKEITAGIEEEGVLFEIMHRPSMPAIDLAEAAATDSRLSIGIGVHRHMAEVIQIASGRAISIDMADSGQGYRKAGANAARVVKRKPIRN